MMPYYQTPYPGPGPGPQPVPPGGRPNQSSISIWAGDLDSYMDETFLRNAVAACGWAADITRIKVVRDRYNGMHAGYGFLDAASPDAAARVLATGSGMPIPGTNRCWRLNMGRNAQGGGSQGASPAGTETNVYVGDLEPNVTDFELMSAFRPRFPSTRHAKVVCNDFGQSRGFGFVRFANSAEAERAVQEMNGFEFHGKPIRLSPANGRPKGGGGPRGGYGSGNGGPGGMQHSHHNPHGGGAMLPHGGFGGREHHSGPTNKRPRQVMAPDDPNNTTLFIGGTGTHVTEDILWREFSIFGELEAVRVPVNKTGFAFVRFKTRDAAQRAKDDMSGTHFISLNPHKPVRLEWASEQIAVTTPPPAAAQQMQQHTGQQQPFAPYGPYGQGQGGDPATAAQAAAAQQVAAQAAAAGNTVANNGVAVPPASGSGVPGVDAEADSVAPAGSPTMGPPGTIGESDGPPSKRAAVGRPEYSPDGEPSGEQASGDEFAGSGGSGDAPVGGMPFPWLNSQSAPSSTPQ